MSVFTPVTIHEVKDNYITCTLAWHAVINDQPSEIPVWMRITPRIWRLRQAAPLLGLKGYRTGPLTPDYYDHSWLGMGPVSTQIFTRLKTQKRLDMADDICRRLTRCLEPFNQTDRQGALRYQQQQRLEEYLERRDLCCGGVSAATPFSAPIVKFIGIKAHRILPNIIGWTRYWTPLKFGVQTNPMTFRMDRTRDEKPTAHQLARTEQFIQTLVEVYGPWNPAVIPSNALANLEPLLTRLYPIPATIQPPVPA